jgi:DNA-binding NtrC family response regulator
MSDETVRQDPAPQSLALRAVDVTVVGGPDTGGAARMTGRRLAIGTAPDNDLVLTDRTVSRHHVVLESTGDEVRLRDLDSTNGTRVDGVRVLSAVAEAGRRVTLGDTTLELSDPAEAPRVELAGTDRFGGLVGSSLLMRELYAILERAAGSDASVLLHGETGTGKELAAEAIHEESSRRDGPFVVVDCGAIPSTLFESELFGHVRGAFTGAIRDQTGLLVQASGGTIFLDEIGELLPELQPKLLRALERREVRPVGAGRSVGIDVRVIAATHRDLPTEVNRGTFREDLYFRLAVLRVRLPPLRARSEDVPRLVRLFVDRLAPERADDADEITATLAHRSFPGNVRELRNAVEELLVLGGFARRQPPGATRAEAGFAEELFDLSYKEASDAALQRFQREYVARLLARTSGNVSLAAREADMSRRYLQTLVARLGLSDTD